MAYVERGRIELAADMVERWALGDGDDDKHWMFVMTGDSERVDREVAEIFAQGYRAGLATHLVVGDRRPTHPMTQLAARTVSGASPGVVEHLQRLAAARKRATEVGNPATSPVLVVLFGARSLFEANVEGWRQLLEACPDGGMAVLTVLDDVDVRHFAGSEALKAVCTSGGVRDLCTQD